ncbi:MAG: peptide/nickel transport system permease protein [Saprospiraceae bacterium]|jgi:peptide/nickel transport system permease protein
MLKFLFKRFLLFIPTLLIISLISFGLSRVPAGDPVDNCFDPSGEIDSRYSYEYAENAYKERAKDLGMHLPTFYCSFTAQAYPDTLYKIARKTKRETIEKLIAQYGNWSEIEIYFKQLKTTELAILSTPFATDANNKIQVLREIRQLPLAYKKNKIEGRLQGLQKATEQDSILNLKVGKDVDKLIASFAAVEANATTQKLYLPDFKWYGFDNQYHRWITNFLQGDFGISCVDKRPVADKISEAIFWTLLMNTCAIILGYLIAIPLGVQSAIKRGSRFDKIVSIGLFILYSLPVFWIGTMALIFFATPEYGMQIFPGVGLGDSGSNTPFWTRFWERASHLILPILCLAYPSFAFLSRQMRGGMTDVLKKDFIRTARAKGLPESQVIRKHAFRNSLFPIITLLASVFPRVLGGALILEIIFNIPGMGKLAFDALFAQDWNVVFTVLMLSAVLTMIGILVADILYAWADPRVRLK